jgi:L-ascorbate metabolism protein UlaG (beta-lactamase superfamily)
MKLTWLDHSAFRIEPGAAKILTDPFLSDNPEKKEFCQTRQPIRDLSIRVLHPKLTVVLNIGKDTLAWYALVRSDRR